MRASDREEIDPLDREVRDIIEGGDPRRRQGRSPRRSGGIAGREKEAAMRGPMNSEMEAASPLTGSVRYLERRPTPSRPEDGPPPAPRRRPSNARLAALSMGLAALLLSSFRLSGSVESMWRRTLGEPIKSCVPIPEPREVVPIFTASYPGSGAKLTWKLLRAVTGIMTGDDHDHNGLVSKGQVVSIKTHYPAINNEKTEGLFGRLSGVGRVMLLLRHPMNALPSYHNFEYERANGLPNHSTRAPIEEWERWRDGRFEMELEAWERHVRFWVERYPYENRTVTLFERLASGDMDVGLAEIRRVRSFLRDGDARVTASVPDEDLPCIWETVVADKRVGYEGKRRHSLRKGGAVRYPFQPEQLDRMEAMLRGLREYRPGQLGPYMDVYIDMIAEARREGAHPKGAEERGEASQERRVLAKAEEPKASKAAAEKAPQAVVKPYMEAYIDMIAEARRLSARPKGAEERGEAPQERAPAKAGEPKPKAEEPKASKAAAEKVPQAVVKPYMEAYIDMIAEKRRLSAHPKGAEERGEASQERAQEKAEKPKAEEPKASTAAAEKVPQAVVKPPAQPQK